MADAANDDNNDTGGSTLATATEFLVPSWLVESKPAHHFWACLVQPLYEPFTSRALPAAVTLPLFGLVLVLLAWLGAATGDGDADGAHHRRHKRRKRRRSALWARLRSLPAYSILFAYVATGTRGRLVIVFTGG